MQTNIITAQISCCSRCVTCIIIPNAHIASEECSDSDTSVFLGLQSYLGVIILSGQFSTFMTESQEMAPNEERMTGLTWRQAEGPFMSSRNVPGMAIMFSSSGGEQARLSSKYTARGNIMD